MLKEKNFNSTGKAPTLSKKKFLGKTRLRKNIVFLRYLNNFTIFGIVRAIWNWKALNWTKINFYFVTNE